MRYGTNHGALHHTAMMLLAAAVCLWATDLYAAATVVGQTLVSSVRTSRTTFDYTYTVTLSNARPALNSATINVTSSAPSTVVLKSSVSVPAIAAGATITTTDTFVISQNRLVPFSWSNITFTVVPGPGPVAQGDVTAAAGGTISVTDPGDPLFGTTVVIPPGALGDPTDTITIGYANALPAPLNANATAAGVIPVGPAGAPVLTLSKLGPTPFQLAVTVTVPYSVGVLGKADYPAVVYWDPDLNQYQPIQVVAINQTNGFVTFATKHFTYFTFVGDPGLKFMLDGTIPYVPELESIDTGFRPKPDGFEVRNFASAIQGANGGVCFGVTSYAAWYFMTASALNFPLYQKYSAASDPGLTHVPQEDAVARELLVRTYIDTINDPQTGTKGLTQLPAILTVEDFLVDMLVTNSPQIAYIQSYSSLVEANPTINPHSVLLYSWNSATSSFLVYDPNYPDPLKQPPSMVWDSFSENFDIWQSGYPFQFIFFDAYSTHYDTADLQKLFISTQTGPPTDTKGGGWNFNTLTITSPLGVSNKNAYPGGTNGPVLTVDPVNRTSLTFTWNCPSCVDASSTPTQYVSLSSAFLHVYQNNKPMTAPTLIENGGSVQLPINQFSGSSNELFAYMSSDSQDLSLTGPNAQLDTSGYAGYQRVELAPNEVVINVTGTLTGWVGLPTTISASGFYATSIASFEANGTNGNTCSNSTVASGGERGYPLFSQSVNTAANFDGATTIAGTPPIGYPYESSGPLPSYNPCSSFFAQLTDSNGNGTVWVNATARGQKFGSFTEDWEYQLRYYSGSPVNNYSDASCTLGVVPNDNAFSGTPVQCTIKCNTALLGKLPICSN